MSAPSVSWDEILPDARGYLGLEDGEAVPRNELVEQANANGWSEREAVQSLRDTDDVVPAGDGLESGLVLADELERLYTAMMYEPAKSDPSNSNRIHATQYTRSRSTENQQAPATECNAAQTGV